MVDTKKEFENKIDEAVAETPDTGDFAKDMEIINKEKSLDVKRVGINIQGLEDVPASIIPVPFVRLVQPTSTKTEMSDGKEAPAGTFFYNDTKETADSMSIVILRGKHGLVEYERDGEKTKSSKLAILGWDLVEEKLFILSLSVMSFSNFGSLVAQLKKAEVNKIWTKEIIVKSEKQENEKGKYYIAKFEIGNDVSKELVKDLEEKYLMYSAVLDRESQEEEKEAEIVS